MTALLETIGLQKAFGAVVAASDISVAVEPGEKLGLIGNNGAGKTTFVNIVTGHLKPDAGKVMLDGENITGRPPRQVRRNGVSRSFQIPQLFASLTPEEKAIFDKWAGAVNKSETNRYRIDPVMSYVSKEVRASDPDFWNSK